MPAEGTLGRDQGEQGQNGPEEGDAAEGTRGDVVHGRAGLGRLGGQQEEARTAEGSQPGQAQARPSAAHAAAAARQGATGPAADRAVEVVSATRRVWGES